MDHVERVRQGIADLNHSYLDCPGCPPERNCCANSYKYSKPFSADQARAIMQGTLLETLVSEGNLTRILGGYEVTVGSCPALTEDYLCKIHDEREALYLTGCIDFPFQFLGSIQRIGKPSIEGPLITLDYTCHSIEIQFPKMIDDLTFLSLEHFLPLFIKYENSGKRILEFTRFIELHKQGKIPLQ